MFFFGFRRMLSMKLLMIPKSIGGKSKMPWAMSVTYPVIMLNPKLFWAWNVMSEFDNFLVIINVCKT